MPKPLSETTIFNFSLNKGAFLEDFKSAKILNILSDSWFSLLA